MKSTILNRKTIAVLLAWSSTAILTGCLGEPDRYELRKFVVTSVEECGGEVGSVTLIRESLLSNKFVGFAEVSVGAETFSPDLVAYFGSDGAGFWKLQQDVCALARLGL